MFLNVCLILFVHVCSCLFLLDCFCLCALLVQVDATHAVSSSQTGWKARNAWNGSHSDSETTKQQSVTKPNAHHKPASAGDGGTDGRARRGARRAAGGGQGCR